MIRLRLTSRSAFVLVAGVLCAGLGGCTQKQLQMAAQLSTALNEFIQNKSLAEQAVREVKVACSVPDSEPGCEQVRGLYEEARDLNDQLVSQIAVGAKPSIVRSLHGVQPSAVRDAAVRFLSQASIILSPGLDTRSIPLEKTIVISDGLPEAARKIDGTTRAMMINTYGKQVKWTPWDAISPADSAQQGTKE